MNPTVLIVEDHEAVRASLRDWLSVVFQHWGLLEAKSGEEAVDLARRHNPDIILMDISLPGMNGIETTRRIKAAVPQAQVVMLTIHEAPEYQADAMAAGASAYIVKRHMHRDLIPVLQRLLSSSAGTTHDPVSQRSEVE